MRHLENVIGRQVEVVLAGGGFHRGYLEAVESWGVIIDPCHTCRDGTSRYLAIPFENIHEIFWNEMAASFEPEQPVEVENEFAKFVGVPL